MTTTVFRQLPCQLTDGERIERGQQLAKATNAIGVEEFRQEGIKRQMKATLGAIESEQSRLAEVVSSGEEVREVECESRITDKQTIEVVRLDTGEVVESRRATDQELQGTLALT